MTDFERELSALINRHSLEGESDTPDFILAKYMAGCLKMFALATQERTRWHDDNAADAAQE